MWKSKLSKPSTKTIPSLRTNLRKVPVKPQENNCNEQLKNKRWYLYFVAITGLNSLDVYVFKTSTTSVESNQIVNIDAIGKALETNNTLKELE